MSHKNFYFPIPQPHHQIDKGYIKAPQENHGCYFPHASYDTLFLFIRLMHITRTIKTYRKGRSLERVQTGALI